MRTTFTIKYEATSGQGGLFARRLETITLGKSYLFNTSSEEPLPGGILLTYAVEGAISQTWTAEIQN